MIEDAKISVSAPASLPIRTEVRGFDGGEQVSKDGRHYWEWSYENKRVDYERRTNLVSPFDYAPRLTANDYACRHPSPARLIVRATEHYTAFLLTGT